MNENLGAKTDLKEKGFTDVKAATDRLRSTIEKGFAKSEAATDRLRSTIEKGFADANAARGELRSGIEKAIAESDAANEKRFATLYRYLLGVGATLVVIMITLFLAN